MTANFRAAFATGVVALMTLTGCTGGEESSAAQTAAAGPQQGEEARRPVDPHERLAQINPAIPLYSGAAYDSDLTRRDNATLASRYGDGTVVYTLTTSDSFPQVWHYYVTYLAQYRQFDPLPAFPPSNQVQRTIDVKLNQVMKDPFVPGDSLEAGDKDVTLQIMENDSRTRTMIRYVVRPPQPTAPVVAATAGLDSSTAAAR